MDDQKNAIQIAAAILSAYLPYIWHNNPPSTGDRAKWQAITRFWTELSPALRAVPGGFEAVSAAMDQPTEINLKQLASFLQDVMDENPNLRAVFESTLTDGLFADMVDQMTAEESGGLEEWAARIRQQMTSDQPQTSAAAEATFYKGVPSCDVCGRQDSTLRFVSYPYVMSFILVSLRRSFIGLWCGRHAMLRQGLASLITVTIGWLGIPFGFLFTPITLGRLASGGIQPTRGNQQMLRDLARHKHSEGDDKEAIRCMEAALEFGDDDAIHGELVALYRVKPQRTMPGPLTHVILFSVVLLGAFLLGIAIGFADHTVNSLLAPIFARGDTIIDVILSWVPTTLFLFFGTLILSGGVRATLRQTGLNRRFLARFFSIVSSLLTLYAVPSCLLLIDLLNNSAINFNYFPGVIHDISWCFTRGGFYYLKYFLTSGETWRTIYLLILLAATVLFIWTSILWADRTTSANQLFRGIRREAAGSPQESSAAGWVSLFGVGALFAVMLMASFVLPSSRSGQLTNLLREGMTALNSGDIEGARTAFDRASDVDSTSFIPHLGYAALGNYTGQCTDSLRHLEAAERTAPEDVQSTLSVLSGSALLCIDHVNAAISSLERASTLNPSIATNHEQLGIAYLRAGKFELAHEQFITAAEIEPHWLTPVMYLAILDYWSDDPQQEEQHLQAALAEAFDEADEYSTVAGYYMQKNDFSQAESYLQRGLAFAPDYSNSLYEMATIKIYLSKYTEAEAVIDRLDASSAGGPSVYFLRSSLYLEQNRSEQALQVLQDGLSAYSDSPMLHSSLALAYVFLEQYDLGIKEALLALATDPYSVTAHTALALAYEGQEQPNSTFTAAERVLELYPKSDLAYYVLGNYYMDQGDPDMARTMYQTFLNLTWDRAYVRDYVDHAREALAQIQAAP